MSTVDQYLGSRLSERVEAGNLRRLPQAQHGIDFRSNDYLGIATSGVLSSFVCEPSSPTGSTGSRLISGNSRFTEETEELIADFHGAEAALIFNSGYDANIGLLSSVAARNTTFIYDELCHASIIDGIRLAVCHNKIRFAHNNLQDLEEQLAKGHDMPIVVVESVYSMDGDMAPLQEMVELCERYGAQLIVDEAHATGVIGLSGEGLVCNMDLHSRVFARIHTFGKALGCHGAAVVGSKLLRDYLVNFARTFIYTTALPPKSIQDINNAYHYLQAPGFTNRPIHDLTALFKSKMSSAGITGFVASETPIQALISGGNDATKRRAATLQQAGLLVKPILSPTVPAGKERIRFCLHSFNTEEQIDLLVKHLSV